MTVLELDKLQSLTEVAEALDAKRRELHQIFAEAGEDLDMTKVKCIGGTTEDKASEIERRNNELTVLGQKKDRLEATKEALDDVSFLESQLRGRLSFGVIRIEEEDPNDGT